MAYDHRPHFTSTSATQVYTDPHSLTLSSITAKGAPVRPDAIQNAKHIPPDHVDVCPQLHMTMYLSGSQFT